MRVNHDGVVRTSRLGAPQAFQPPIPDWYEDAVCAQTDIDGFYPETGQYQQALQACKVCSGCPARLKCLQDALDRNERWGIWGGMTYRQRRELAKGLSDAG